MSTTDKTPLWLDLKKEYVDDNFEKLQKYLEDSTEKGLQDTFYNITLELLRERIKDLLKSLSERAMYKEEEDKNNLKFNIRLLATYLLADKNNALTLPAYIAFMNELCRLNPRQANGIIDTIMRRLKYEQVNSLGFNWKSLNQIGTDLFAHNACKLATFSKPLEKPLVLSQHGTALLTKDGLILTHESKEEAKKLLKSGASSMNTGIGIMLRTTAAEKLKQSKENSIKDMDEFTKDFILGQAKVQKKKASRVLNVYSDGDEVIIKITSISNGNIYVETTNPAYRKIEGVIKFERPSLVYYYTNSLWLDFQTGDYLRATVKDGEAGIFNIEKQFVRFIVEDTREATEESDEPWLAKLIDEKDNSYGWINEWGVAMYTPNTGEYHRGDFALLAITEYGIGQFYGKIHAKIVRSATTDFDETAARHKCIRAFAKQEEKPIYQNPAEDTGELSPEVLKILTRLLFEYQKSLLNPADRFRYLANANIMAEMVCDDLSASYLNFARTYLRALIQFANKEDIKNLHLSPDEEYRGAKPTLIRLSVIELLKEYGRKDNSERLADAIRDFEESIPMLARLARLIQTANSMQGTLSEAALNVIRREIIKTLSIETENEADLEADSGAYLGIESGTQEFKTSMVFPAGNNMQPNEKEQNDNVMKGICAFLNSTTGGTLYVGVNDQGYVSGIKQDMAHLKIQSIDAYMRYIQDIAIREMGIDSMSYVRMEALYDESVVAIHIDPHPYRVVELKGVSYLRVNAESRIMPEHLRQEMIAKKVFVEKDKAAAISKLQHACAQKKCVILHNYASSNSGKVSNRKVEAYDVRPEDGLVCCYDREKFAVRVFNINRIGYVEILEEEPWKYPASHESMNVDIFHMTGKTLSQVSLQLDLFAKNLLVEEYPAAKQFIKPHQGDENIWYFDTKVCDMAGVGRFYIGLANHIKILEGEALKQYAIEYGKKYLTK